MLCLDFFHVLELERKGKKAKNSTKVYIKGMFVIIKKFIKRTFSPNLPKLVKTSLAQKNDNKLSSLSLFSDHLLSRLYLNS